ncbi:multicopper oxidase family protein [Dactylosporangium matsuzakiense]|uniref:Spore coat protein A n=1 Tax=Dactylosporangium matsuzakiense TaxID=53360 RepID=A0A9W6KJV5_9ACTN|nr:multicopper oxidase family protein [Dactylosporangium matsuzakiense]UWZ47576.1 multicopper oxidase family protein [Dactylosporangium matsuzakiense]GLL01596.1 spore coat protein A [Dactylosporangium matsuzakiense]
MKRRAVLGAGAAALGAAGIGWSLLTPKLPGKLLHSRAPLPRPFEARLAIPAVLAGEEIVQREADLAILPGLTTRAWTYNGSFPGPTVVTRSGRAATVMHRNQLPEPVVVHLHGGHTPAGSDGYPIDQIMPLPPAAVHHDMATMAGDTTVGARTYRYPMQQRAATLWYHDHRMGFTGPAVYRGLAGFHLVRDDEEDALPLPRGERELPLMITDRAFEEDGSFRYPLGDADYMNGVLGDVILVNGRPWPVHEVDPARYRLRLLNASNARRYRLQFDPQPPGGDAFVQIGSDGGLLTRPMGHDTLELAPAERFDVVVDFARWKPGTKIRLIDRDGGDVMRFDVTGPKTDDPSRVPPVLSTSAEPLPPPKRSRTFRFGQGRDGTWRINDLTYQPGRALARPRLGEVEHWRFVTDFHHPIHLHLNHFQVVSRNANEIGEYDRGWKDTVDLRASEAVEIAVRFTDYTGTFMLHCHNLEHEDMAMMADFVVEP